jgi:hypothetical protein
MDANDVTSEDNTPYAQALASGGHGWRAMCKWVYGAGKQRLMHLGLMRPSGASRRFARINLVVFAFAVAVVVFVNSGWQVVRQGPGESLTLSPVGKGWAHVAERSASVRPPFPGEVVATDLWWNVPRAIVSGTVALLTVLPLSLVLVWIVATRAQKAMRTGDRDYVRFRCAVHYSTAWAHFISVAVLIELGRPLVRALHVMGAIGVGSPAIVDVPAVLVALVGVLMWWFWLIRLGDTAPKDIRSAVSRVFVAWTPVWAILIGGGTAFGLHFLFDRLAIAFNLNW